MQSVNSRFMIDQIAWSFEALFTETTWIALRWFVNILNVFLQCVQVRRSLPAIAAGVFELLRSVIFDVAIVRLEISQEMSANFTAHSVLSTSGMCLHVLIYCIFGFECLWANFTNLDVVRRVRVVLKLWNVIKMTIWKTAISNSRHDALIWHDWRISFHNFLSGTRNSVLRYQKCAHSKDDSALETYAKRLSGNEHIPEIKKNIRLLIDNHKMQLTYCLFSSWSARCFDRYDLESKDFWQMGHW